MRHLFLFLFIALLSSTFFSGCRKDVLDEDADAQLNFSTDTIVFDTVFTTVGSATRNFKIYNTSSKAVRISSIRMAGGSASNFRMNVDGTPSVSTGDILLRGGDSMYVFVDVTVDPNNSNSPLMIEDSILFETNGNHQKVVLNAVGQDAYFHYYEYLNCNEVWVNDKPHVIYGYAIVPSCCMLTIQQGSRVYLHKNGILAVDSCATLQVFGTAANPVTFQGDRLEHEYAEEPGQWNFIWLSSLSKDNVIDWAVIKNANVGVLCDTLGGSANPTLHISNTKISNMALAGIFGRGTWIEGENLAISNCAEYCAALAYGGKYKFVHCSFGNYYDISTRSSPALLLNNWYEGPNQINIYRDLVQADFHNCIIYGDVDDEVGLDTTNQNTAQYNYFFNHCLLKTTTLNTSNPAHFQNIVSADPQFRNVSGNDLRIWSTSPAIDMGDLNFIISPDLNNAIRPNGTQCDIGAYEYYP